MNHDTVTAVQGRWVLAAAILGSSMAFIDGSVVNVALPSLQSAFTAGGAAVQWVVNAYALTLGSLILVGGAAGDQFGRRRVFLAGVMLFAAASAACAAAPSVWLLVAARAVQGMGGALMVPGSLALVAAAFDGEARVRAVGTWAGAGALTTALGPALGGWLVGAASWRAIFLINLPLAAATAWIAARRVPEGAVIRSGRLDWEGAALAVAGLSCLTWGATALGQPGRSWAWPAAATVVSVGLLGGFVAREARARQPMLPLDLFRSRAFSGANLATLLLYGGLSAMVFLLPFALIRVRGMSAAAAGASFLPFSLLVGLLSRFTGRLTRWAGTRLLLVVGPLLAASGLAWLAQAADGGSSFVHAVLPGMVLLGLGMAITIPPLTTAAFDAAGDERAGIASGVNTAVARVAGLLAVATLGSLVLLVQASALPAALVRVGANAELRAQAVRAAPAYAEAILTAPASASDQELVDRAVVSAFGGAFRSAAFACAVLAAAAAGAAGWAWRPGRAGPPQAGS